MTNPRIHLIFTPEKDLAGEVVLYTVIGMPVEGTFASPFPERSFTSIENLERAIVPMVSPDVFEKIRHALEAETKFIFEVDAEQAAAFQLHSTRR